MRKNLLKLLPVALMPITLSACNYTDPKLNEELKKVSITPVRDSVDSSVSLDDFASDKYLKVDGLSPNNKIIIKKIQKVGDDNLLVTFEIVDKATRKTSEQKTQQIHMKYIDSSSQSNSTNNKFVYEKNNYYSSLNGLRGKELFEELSKIQAEKVAIKNSREIINQGPNKHDYQYAELYNIYKTAFADNFFEKDQSIIDIYSENPNGKDPYVYSFNNYEGRDKNNKSGKKINNTKGEGSVFNREHTVPQSWFNKEPNIRTDAHFVFPSDKKVNADRGNGIYYTVDNGAKISLNGTKTTANYTEPIDAFKGDLARATLYFVLTYPLSWEDGKGSADLFKNTFPYLNKKYLDTYIDWSKKDGIDGFDIQRNNEIAKYYGGLRNPFSDYPNLASLIFGTGDDVFVDKGILVGLNQ
ncbi:endonuclease [Mycoplasma sp. HS2188]|uniref:endonuclease n=1 Tax=Mycoplasma sp. HS2188 TaxID=2976765 RepID=UPI0021AAB8BA|nr:endonuclease [Mycoplasma sp. HS2188]MCT4469690.1 endonuclease [Mycoplasma sp. HS2188]